MPEPLMQVEHRAAGKSRGGRGRARATATLFGEPCQCDSDRGVGTVVLAPGLLTLARRGPTPELPNDHHDRAAAAGGPGGASLLRQRVRRATLRRCRAR